MSNMAAERTNNKTIIDLAKGSMSHKKMKLTLWKVGSNKEMNSGQYT